VLQGGLHPFKFNFPRVEMPYESYDGINARCRYYVRVTVSRASYASSNITKDLEFAVRNVEPVRVGLACR
jgi:vacuolar protein sorting-associated protein 26